MSANAKIRQRIRQQRNQSDKVSLDGAADKVARQLLVSPHYQHAQHIAAYIAVNNELNPRQIIEAAWQAGKQVYLPILQDESRVLQFAAYTSNSKLLPNRFGIPEPLYTNERPASAADMDLIIVPLVAFNSRCHRLGMGAGYYDHTLEAIHHTSTATVGVAYSFQHEENIQVQPWDVALNFVITDTMIYTNPDNQADKL